MTLRATYRVQFHAQFTFTDAERLVPYLAELGISHLYCSPILTARAGSTHGYDVVDHARINEELGGETAFRSLVTALRARHMGVILDIVPNHMAVGGADNPYWLDVLEKGRESVFATLFDIDWDDRENGTAAKVVVPLLGKPLRECISAHEITVLWDARLGKLAFAYHDNRFPIRPDDYVLVAGEGVEPADADLSRFAAETELGQLLARQHYRLAFWRDAGDRINWRRFFDITSLAAVRVEDDAVFEQTHATIFRLYGEGLIDGVRVDHVDGLADPAAYCRRLRARLEAITSQRPEFLPREPALVFVEKILADGETLPADWGVDGTTGYDFMDAASGLLHDPAAEATFTRLWTSTSGRSPSFEDEERIARREMLDSAFANALRTTAAAFAAVSGSATSDLEAIARAIALLVERFRGYRTYAVGDSAEPAPGPIFDDALAAARADVNLTDAAALELVAAVVRGNMASTGDVARDAVRRFNQLSAPIAAKAVEDTAFYRYGRLLSRNDVGCTAVRFAITMDALHGQNQHRSEHFPAAMLATATHDHKRGEDVRARLAALTDVPSEWESAQREWFTLNAALRHEAIAPGDEYQLYQTLVGSWPHDLSPHDVAGMSAFTERILGWREKSLREAKLQTSWSQPDEALERAHAEFVRRVLAPDQCFAARLASFAEWLAPAGALNSLTTCALRYTVPGTPDLYQGTELWDLSLVDPDNRRPVDYPARHAFVAGKSGPDALLASWKTGGVKAVLIRQLLALRQRYPSLFAQSTYMPIATTDGRLLSFARVGTDGILLVAIPYRCSRSAIAQQLPLPDPCLGAGVGFDVPDDWRKRDWRDGLDPQMPLTPIWNGRPMFLRFPVCVLFSEGAQGANVSQ